MLICVSEFLAVKQLRSSFSPAEKENSANLALSQDYFYGYLGRYDRNQESKWKQNIFHRKREKLFHAGEFRSWFSASGLSRCPRIIAGVTAPFHSSTSAWGVSVVDFINSQSVCVETLERITSMAIWPAPRFCSSRTFPPIPPRTRQRGLPRPEGASPHHGMVIVVAFPNGPGDWKST
jgi:hypothetical protein